VRSYGEHAQPTGLHFKEQTVESVIKGISQFEKVERLFDPLAIRAFARTFDTSVLVSRMQDSVRTSMAGRSAAVDPQAWTGYRCTCELRLVVLTSYNRDVSELSGSKLVNVCAHRDQN
jgi:hypothetical protein